MQSNGFSEQHPIPINRNDTILGGAHRTSCALAIGCKVFVEQFESDFTWPLWGQEWFIDNGMAGELPWINRAYDELKIEPSARQSEKTTMKPKGTRGRRLIPIDGEF